MLKKDWNLPAALAFLAGTFTMAGADVRPLVGTYSKLKVKHSETVRHIARVQDVSSELLSHLNHVRGSRVRAGQTLTLPTLHIVPRQPQEGIVLNIPERHVYLFRGGQVKAVYPVALGSAAWATPTGTYKLASKETNPIWKPTKEMVEREDIKDEPVPPGKDNPVGDRWMGWSKKGFGFHSTKAPDSIGGTVTHGCVRLYPEAAHKMFDLVRVGEPIYVEYTPIVVGHRDDRYYLSVFPDVYHKNLVTIRRAQAILKKEGLLSRVNMKEIAQIVRKHTGYPQQLHLRSPAAARKKPSRTPGRNPGKKPAQHGKPGKRTTSAQPAPQPASPGAKPPSGGQPVPPGAPSGMTPEEIALARAQWTLLLNRYRSGKVKLVNERRDLVQLEQLSAQGFLATSDRRTVAIDKHLGQALARLANHTSSTKPLVVMSIYRAYSSRRPHEPHSNGLAADISAFGGHTIDNRRPSEALACTLQILETLPPGRYRLGLPKPPHSDPEAFLPPPQRPREWPFFPAPLASTGQIGAVTLVLPRLARNKPATDSAGRFLPQVTRWANERSAPPSELGDARLRKALASSARHGVVVLVMFPDAADHLHLDVIPDKPDGMKRPS